MNIHILLSFFDTRERHGCITKESFAIHPRFSLMSERIHCVNTYVITVSDSGGAYPEMVLHMRKRASTSEASNVGGAHVDACR
jgi:hypothetical protein